MSGINLHMEDRNFIIDTARRIIPIKAISPDYGGNGESKRADEISKMFEELGFKNYERYDIKDDNGIVRTSLVLKVGHQEKTLWLVSHSDTFPEDDRVRWKYPPFEATIEGDRIYGKGSMDNGQPILLSLLLLKNLKVDLLKYNLGIAIVADEETGGRYGIEELLKRDIFSMNDLIIVLDYRSEHGLNIDVAEKSVLWVKFTIKGKQGHARSPQDSINSNREGMKFMLELDKRLHSKFDYSDETYSPPYSTFEPTKRECNVENINTVPGIDIQYLDGRVLPRYDLDKVLDEIVNTIDDFEKTTDAVIEHEVVLRRQAPPIIDLNSETVRELKESIKNVREYEVRLIGVGVETCASHFRNKGYEAVAWYTAPVEVYHKPNEYCEIGDIFEDSKVIENILYH